MGDSAENHLPRPTSMTWGEMGERGVIHRSEP